MDAHTDTQTRHWRPGPASQRRLRWRCRPIPSLATRIRTCVGRIRTQREPPEERGTLSLRQPHPHTLRRSQKRCSDPSQSRKWVALSHTTRASTSESHTGQKSASTEPYSQPCIPCASQLACRLMRHGGRAHELARCRMLIWFECNSPATPRVRRRTTAYLQHPPNPS